MPWNLKWIFFTLYYDECRGAVENELGDKLVGLWKDATIGVDNDS